MARPGLGQIIAHVKRRGAHNRAVQGQGELVGTLPHPTIEYLYVELLQAPDGHLLVGAVVDHTGQPTGDALTDAERLAIQQQVAEQQRFLAMQQQRLDEAQALAKVWNGA